ncbi:MAG TPA: ABC transporter permease [Bacteroidales bacterium]|jgi:phospholipid/cholesterol/gamma-HCH transport system permease protein|nr:ABC transporter permease [Bacteroidales bacterium]
MKYLFHFGRYLSMLRQAFQRPEKQSIYFRQVLVEMEGLGLASVGIVAIISVFMGAVLAIQMAFNIDTPLIPSYTIGFVTRQSVELEFSPTIISLILAGKVGSRIASELGTMRVTEQIDALEIMGINPATFLILPKIIASMIINPFLIMMSMLLAVIGGWFAGISTGLFPSAEYIYGIQSFFHMYDIFYAITKTVVFAFIIASVSAYHGFYTKGGALEVGEASTNGVVYSSIAIIFMNLILTQILLA